MFHLIFFCGILCCSMLSRFILAALPEQNDAVSGNVLEIGKICSEENILTEDDYTKLKDLKVARGPNVPCFIACLTKQYGMMDDSGRIRTNIDVEKAKPLLEDAEGLKTLQGYLDTCSYVNNKPVSDGEEGCDRALLLYKCITENGLKAFFQFQ